MILKTFLASKISHLSEIHFLGRLPKCKLKVKRKSLCEREREREQKKWEREIESACERVVRERKKDRVGECKLKKA